MKDKNTTKKDRFKINEPGVYIYGQRTAVIDGNAEIYEYSDNEVVFSLPGKKRLLTVYGRSLSVRCAGRSVSEVSGHIDGVKYGVKNVKAD
ncbi:MAG: YabP/YqfC family sporulation protein [Clostridia bacterium]|nr:YabP/YqfC family sporulation protein [Clostridia bacterium]